VSDSNQATLRAALEAFNDPNRRQEYLDIYAPDVILHGYPRGLAGLEGARSFYSQLWRAFPDARLTVDGVIAHETRSRRATGSRASRPATSMERR